MPRLYPCVLILLFIFSSRTWAWYDENLPVPVMHLEGSVAEIAQAHGKIAAQAPHGKETLLFFSKRMNEIFSSSPFFANHPRLYKIAWWLYSHFIRNEMVERIPRDYQNAYENFSKEMGLPLDSFWDALILPDASLRIASLLYHYNIAPLLEPSFGCTSIIWSVDASSSLHGRNLDYDGVGIWDHNPVILHIVPKEGLAHIAVSALGVHAPGITAFNEAGLTLAVHQLTLDATKSSGVPMPIISAEVIRRASTIEEAIAIIRSFPRIGGWAYVLSQGKERAVVETSAYEVMVRRSSQDFFYQTNHVFSPAIANHQIYYSPGSWIDSFDRTKRLSQIRHLVSSSRFASVQKMATFLGDRTDEFGHEKIAGGTIAKLDNIQSVIVDPSNRRLWIGMVTENKAPNEYQYIAYQWQDLRSSKPPILLQKSIHVDHHSYLRELLRASMQSEESKKIKFLSLYVKEVEKIINKSNLYGVWPGLYLYVWEVLKTSESSSEKAKYLLRVMQIAVKDQDLLGSTITSKYRLSLGYFYQARLLDLLNQRKKALVVYSTALKLSPFKSLQNVIKKHLHKPFTWDQAREISIDWAGIDLFKN